MSIRRHGRMLALCVLLLAGCWNQTAAAEPAEGLWRVLSQRIILPEAAHRLIERLEQRGFAPVLYVRREAVELHVFDDPRDFASRAAAQAAQARLRAQGIDADILPTDPTPGHYRLGLARYYLDEYALAFQERLRRAGIPFRYQRMRKRIPVYRLVFPPQPHDQAMRLWRQVHHTGLGRFVLMRERDYRATFANLQPISETKRSNK